MTTTERFSIAKWFAGGMDIVVCRPAIVHVTLKRTELGSELSMDQRAVCRALPFCRRID